MNLEISHWVHINNELALRDGIPALTLTNQPGDKTPENFYHALQHNYPKFFKMDVLCKWAWAGAEYLLSFHDRSLYESLDKSKIAVVMMTSGVLMWIKNTRTVLQVFRVLRYLCTRYPI